MGLLVIVSMQAAGMKNIFKAAASCSVCIPHQSGENDPEGYVMKQRLFLGLNRGSFSRLPRPLSEDSVANGVLQKEHVIFLIDSPQNCNSPITQLEGLQGPTETSLITSVLLLNRLWRPRARIGAMIIQSWHRFVRPNDSR